jgi:pimeloyl-ACP methyl ester carboxylesterase
MNITMPVDHFNASNHDTYDMRYIIDWSFYNASHGPILFYAGNEGAIWNFYNNTGFMAETLAKEMGALVVFAEHRFYGTSLPYYPNTFNTSNLRFLSVEQVMRDFIHLQDFLKSNASNPELNKKATILFGGSYGGMLASWMRMKYPQHFQGALASSAPILWFKGKIDPNAYTRVASDVIKSQGGQDCYDYIGRGFYDLQNVMYDSSKWESVKNIFNLCDVPTKPADI